MRSVPPDFDRRIDLPGAGPCPRPVDLDRAASGFDTLVSLRVYSFARGTVIEGEAEGDEVFVVLMRGAADVRVTQEGALAGDFALRANGGDRVVYLPPHSAYRLSAIADCDIAYARAAPAGTVSAPAAFGGEGEEVRVPHHATRMDLSLATVPAGGTRAVEGCDGQNGERFVHLRGTGTARVADMRLDDWGSLMIDGGEDAAIVVDEGRMDVLTVGAIAH